MTCSHYQAFKVGRTKFIFYYYVGFWTAKMALQIVVGRRSVSQPPMHCDLVTRQSIKEWYKLTSTLLMVLSQKSIDALDLYEQLLLNKDIPVTSVFLIAIV